MTSENEKKPSEMVMVLKCENKYAQAAMFAHRARLILRPSGTFIGADPTADALNNILDGVVSLCTAKEKEAV